GLETGNTYILKLSAELTDADGLELRENQEILFEVKPVDEPEASIVFDFEQSALSWSVDSENSINITEGAGNRILRFSTIKLFDGYSYRLLYDFNAPEAQIIVRPPESFFSVQDSQNIGLYVYGNLSDNHLFLLFEKDGVEHEILLTEIDFAGWQFKTCTLDFPEKNEQYNFSGFKLISGQTPFSSTGMIIFDNLMVSDSVFTSSKEILNRENNLKIYPNPASHQIQIEMEAAEGKIPYEIYDLQGKVVQSGITDFAGGRSQITFSFETSGIFILAFNQTEERIRSLFIKK
ncbi:MAG: T9SS type A sorting domain-containing protein, partial [Bacteroidales bacterium]|nr:T9SS type A sorting domain-containing protein [Bacteroidales bacterium]